MPCDQLVHFKPHACSQTCVASFETQTHHIKHVNPLLIPMMHGWQRHIIFSARNKFKFVNYMAPCGRWLRTTSEIDKYLYLVDSVLTIDMFSLEYSIQTHREFEANAKFLKIEDVANGLENMQISCVNCVDEFMPEDYEYSAHRRPLKDVPLKIDPELMECCNCEDNCRDRLKCACWRKTFEATMFANGKVNTNVGYKHRRISEIVGLFFNIQLLIVCYFVKRLLFLNFSFQSNNFESE